MKQCEQRVPCSGKMNLTWAAARPYLGKLNLGRMALEYFIVYKHFILDIFFIFCGSSSEHSVFVFLGYSVVQKLLLNTTFQRKYRIQICFLQTMPMLSNPYTNTRHYNKHSFPPLALIILFQNIINNIILDGIDNIEA